MRAAIAGQAVPGLPVLSENRIARFAAIIALYFLQGIPVGISTVAVPSWLAANGATPLQVGAFVGTALLPWSLKPFAGILMDRFAYKPMGRRRAWILAAQAMMFGALVVMALQAPQASQITLLAALCFSLNLAAILNDVAIDGMAVDLVPDEERTAVNSCMFASQVAGISATSMIAALVMGSGGIASLALVLACVVAVTSLFVSILRERPGERLLPWSPGEASSECKERQHDAWRPILKGMFRAFARPTTMLFLLATAVSQVTLAFIDAVAPTLSVQHLGWTSERYSSFAAVATLIVAGIALVLPTLLARMVGLRWTVTALSLALAALGAIGGLTFASWNGSEFFMVLYVLQYSLAVTITITTIVWAMRICDPAVAASLFALFMAVPNFARSILAGWSGVVVESSGYEGIYFTIAGVTLASVVIFLLARIGDERLVVAPAE